MFHFENMDSSSGPVAVKAIEHNPILSPLHIFQSQFANMHTANPIGAQNLNDCIITLANSIRPVNRQSEHSTLTLHITKQKPQRANPLTVAIVTHVHYYNQQQHHSPLSCILHT